jgi:hypothetical protein
MWDDQAVELSGVPRPDEATLNSYGLIGYELVAVTTVAATGREVAPFHWPLPWSCRSLS